MSRGTFAFVLSHDTSIHKEHSHTSLKLAAIFYLRNERIARPAITLITTARITFLLARLPQHAERVDALEQLQGSHVHGSHLHATQLQGSHLQSTHLQLELFDIITKNIPDNTISNNKVNENNV